MASVLEVREVSSHRPRPLVGVDGEEEHRELKRIGRSHPLRIAATLVPWAFHGLPADDAQQLLALAPPPQRLLLRVTHRRFARRHRATSAHLGPR